MQSLLEFFYRYRAMLLFLVLEVLCTYLIVTFNSYQGASFFNSSNSVTGRVFQVSDNIGYYFSLKSVNLDLAEENASLRTQLQQAKQTNILIKGFVPDTVRVYQYSYVNAKVVNNSVSRLANYFTLDKGLADGLQPGMGVISTNGGIAGRIKSCSEHYSTVLSILNDRWPLSAKIARGNIDGIVEWKGSNPREALLTHVGKHYKIIEGDSVITSGYNNIFPYGMLIGRVSEVIDDGKKYTIKVSLATDYTAMSYVSILKNKLNIEKDSLEEGLNFTIEK